MATATQVANFIAKMAPIAQRQAAKHGNKIYPSVCIAQACHESGYGTSTKMIKANAVFGIKVGKSAYHFGTAWKGDSYNTKTKEYYNGSAQASVIQDNFRAYSSLEDATEDYFDLLCTASRYKAAINAKNYEECIRAIAPSYATGESVNHAYSKAVINIIKTYNLDRYDPGYVAENTFPVPKTTLKMGTKGDAVKWLQWELDNKGYPIGSIDGIYGKKTEECVRQYQQDVFVDGIAGPKTINALQSK